ncbi:UvrD-helicase domain-containing protein [Bartonella sp. TP]|uniref:UvrD-helicase domain-containing protein n=1 Tax=Bartonella sp. TP TaxID=3057550 RepID=UPI0025B04E41|nr:UvrD-helicase domain-containing protein [Bartonella sp. TP]WJW80449.1 UvrD-helicase domain-containing protein [Bartonella sp. TP]
MAELVIPPQAIAATNQATKPLYNVWVSANAGSGKTHVLTLRVIRLLLAGVEPSKILCLTYTKAAANVMKIRIFERLGNWAILPNAELAQEIMAIEGREPSAAELALARQLFARAQDTPGGLKLQTIHGFCDLLLHQFCLEANIPYHFSLMDKQQVATARQQAQLALMQSAMAEGTSDVAQALRYLLSELGESGISSLFTAAAEKYYQIWPALRKAQRMGVQEFLQTALKIEKNQAELLADIADFSNMQQLVPSLAALAGAEGLPQKMAIIESIFYNSKGELFKKLTKQPELEELCAKAVVCRDRYRDLKLLELNQAVYVVTTAFLQNYAQFKQQRAWLEFSDLLYKTAFLLRRQNLASWVHYKLDNAIDHILVDEAQDTSPVQWRIVQLLMAEFYAGAGQKTAMRSSFAVGDEKQSIYRFQGAALLDFAKNGAIIQKKSRQSEKPFSNVKLLYSFRSTQAVLTAVDRVFSFMPTQHIAVRSSSLGYVEIWENLVAKANESQDLLTDATIQAKQLSELIANRIEQLIASGSATAGDIIILVRNRVGPFCDYMLRELKNRRIAVAGLDKLRLDDHIAIRDLCALGRFALQSRDDLALAGLFKSPLFGLSEQDLFRVSQYKIAHNSTLWQALQAQPDLQDMVSLLLKYQKLAYSLPVFEFYNHVLTVDEGRKKIIARLGFEASEVLDEFLRLSLKLQNEIAPGLQSFLAAFETEKIELKREEVANNQLRLLTVHGAKGLEAPIVFLADIAGGGNTNKAGFKMLQNSVPIWYGRKKYQTNLLAKILQQEKAEEEQEHRRLLYVAMTRAREYLFVCGAGKSNEQRWHHMVSTSLLAESKAQPELKLSNGESLAVWRFGEVESDVMMKKQATEAKVESAQALSQKLALLRQPVAIAPLVVPQPLIASDAMIFVEKDRAALPKDLSPISFAPAVMTRATARQVGLAAHKLLQYLPQFPCEKRQQLAQEFLAAHRPQLENSQKTYILHRVFALLNDKFLQDLFSPEARAEIALAGQIQLAGKEYNVSGQIDRLLIQSNQVIFVDYKTGRPARQTNEIAAEHLVQMALYYKLLNNIYSQPIRPLLIYTKNLKYFELDRNILYNALRQHLEKRI